MTKLSMKRGAEGPSHDPYSFSEYTVERDGRIHTLHQGLGVRYSLNGRTLVQSGDNGIACWEAETGLTVAQFERIYQRVHGPKTRCKNCLGKKFEWESGFPGESLQVCVSCNSIVHSEFNESEII